MDSLLQGLRAAAEPTRLRLLALCAHSELTVTDLTQILGQSQPRVSRHLKLLCDAGLLVRYREATFANYRIRENGDMAQFVRTLIDLIPDRDPMLARDLERLDVIKKTRAADADRYFKENAGRWDEIRALYVPEQEVEQKLLALTGDLTINDFVDIGTGTGRMVELFAGQTSHAVGIDTSRDMLALARARLDKDNQRHCQVRLGDMYNLPYENSSFDLAMMHLTLHFADRPSDVITEVARILRPGGRLLIVDFAAHNVERLRGEHQHRWLGFDDAEVASWCLSAGLEPQPTESLVGDPLTVLIWSANRPNRHTAAQSNATERESSS